MTMPNIRDAIFELGQLSLSEGHTNSTLLSQLAEILAKTLEVEIVTLAVFERGLAGGSDLCVIRGPWTSNRPAEFNGDVVWAFEDQNLIQRLGELRRGRVYHRPELVQSLNGQSPGLLASLNRCVNSDDQAIALFRRADGVELLIGFHSPENQGELSRSALQKAGAIAPFVARCWSVGWRREPEWLSELNAPAQQILRLVLDGFDDDQIATETGHSYHSVRAHLKRMFRAAGVRSRLHLMQATRTARDDVRGLVAEPDATSTQEAMSEMDLGQ